MSQHTPFYLKKLRDEFELRINRRPNYSLRAFAKFLEIEAPSLSGVLKGKRRLSKNKVETVANKLNLSPNERAKFIISNGSKVELASLSHKYRYQLNSEVHFRIIAEWEHYAILSLIETKSFKSDLGWIASRLGITELRAQICTDNLVEAGLIQKKDANIIPSHSGVKTTEDIPSEALRIARRQDLDLANQAIDVPVELRDLSSCTLTLNLKDLDSLKEMIRDFRRRFMKRAEGENCDEVYKLSIQLFPLTRVGLR